MNQDVVSFVLRFIREDSGQPATGESAAGEQAVRWRGVIKHVQSDHSADFTHFSDALHFMQTHVDEAIRQAFVDREPLTPDNMLAETARLWGEVAPRYTDLMLQSMEAMFSQGRRMSETFAENFGWGQTAARSQTAQQASAQQTQLLELMERLAAQVETLSGRVEQLEARLRDE